MLFSENLEDSKDGTIYKCRRKIVHTDGNREGIIAVRVRSGVRNFTSPTWSVTDAFANGLSPAITSPVVCNVLPSEMRPGATVKLFITVVLVGAVDV
jgi:hypothetical protein